MWLIAVHRCQFDQLGDWVLRLCFVELYKLRDGEDGDRHDNMACHFAAPQALTKSVSEPVLLTNNLVLIAAYSRNSSKFKPWGDFGCILTGFISL